jgi:hypothetical protein
MWRVAISLRQSRHQRLASRQKVLFLQCMERRVLFDHIIAINENFMTHTHLFPPSQCPSVARPVTLSAAKHLGAHEETLRCAKA